MGLRIAGRKRPRPDRPGLFDGRGGVSVSLCLRLALLIVLLSGVQAAASAAKLPDSIPQGVEMDVFYAKDCKHCRKAEKDIFKPLEKLGVRLFRHEASDRATGRALLEIQSLPEFELVSIDSDGDLPLVFIGRYALEGTEAITRSLERVVSKNDSVLFTAPHKRAREALGDRPLPAMSDAAGRREVNLAYFDNPGCPNCGTANLILSLVETLQPYVRITRFNIRNRQDRLLLEAICRKVAVPDNKRLVTPAVFVGQDCLLERFTRNDVLELVSRYSETGAGAFWHEIDLSDAKRAIVARFRAMGTTGVLLAGLVDGINPCAFATIVFMVMYLTGLGASRAKVVATGVAFSLAVFLTYFAIGAGALGVLQFVDDLPFVRESVLVVGALASLVFGVLSFWDYLVSRTRGLKAGVLRLSGRASARVKTAIAGFARSRWAIAGAFGAGFVVSLTEVVCTGQVYLPTIVFVSQESETRLAGLAALLLYNLAFLAPMIFIFLVVLAGYTAGAIGRFTERHLAKSKLALSFVFVGLALVLGIMAIP